MPRLELKCWSVIDGQLGYNIVDLAPALLSLSRRLDTEYHYQVTTMDGKMHESIKAQHEVLEMTLGCDKMTESGTILGEVAYLVAQSQGQGRPIELIYNGTNEGVCYVKLGKVSTDKTEDDDFVWDMLDITVTLERGGAIEH